MQGELIFLPNENFIMRLLNLIPLFFLFSSISLFSQNKYTYQVPPNLKDDLKVEKAQKLGFNTKTLETLVQKISDEEFVNVDALLIIKDDKLILEEYFNGYNRNRLHTQKSISKSITALLAGIALDKQLIPSLEAKMMDFLPKYQSYRRPEHEKITIHHMLSMTTGIKWREADVLYGTDENDETQMYRRDDWFPYVLEKPIVDEPGTRFEYNGGVANLLAQVVRNTSGTSAELFAEKYLFQPLGIHEFNWSKSRTTGYVSAAAGVHLRPRDMVKLGLLYLNEGKWKNKQIISSSFMKKSHEQSNKRHAIGTIYGGLRLHGFNCQSIGRNARFKGFLCCFREWRANHLGHAQIRHGSYPHRF